MNLMLAVRGLVLLGFTYASAVALTHWAVRRGHLGAFGRWPRLVRRVSDPLLVPLERRIVRAGRNPQDAVWWLLGIAVVGGLVVLSLAGWMVGAWYRYSGVLSAGPRGWAFMAVNATYSVLMIGLFVRVIGSWFGVGRYRPWMRPFYWLTDWMLRPIRRLLPPVGMMDFSPLVAWLALMFLRGALLGLIV